jgi:integrase
MEKNEVRERGKHGWFKAGPHSYAALMKSDAVQVLAETFTPQNRPGSLYQLKHFLDINNLSPEEFLSLPDREIKRCIQKAVLTKHRAESFSAARRMFYVVRRFLELNGRELVFNKTEKKQLLKRMPKRIGKEYIPTREDIYRMVDAFPDKGPLQRKRGQALILCLWQSGVRVSCLCSWTYAMFKDQLWPTIKAPVKIKVVANRPEGIYDCAQDTKLSAYSVNYYFTFLAQEAAEALRDYLEERKKHGWNPQDSDAVFVTHGTVPSENGKPLTAQHVVEIVKNGAKQIGINPQRIWTHCLRKAFRKTLYASGVDPDIAEALMGHKLGASRGSYFDYHDVVFAEQHYKRASWTRIGLDRIQQMESELAELRKVKEEHEKLKANGQQKTAEIEKMQQQITDLQKRLEEQFHFVERLLELASRPSGLKTGRKWTKKIPEENAKKLLKEGKS